MTLSALRHRRELEYLERLLFTRKAVAQLTPIYTELAGVAHHAHSLARALPADLMPVSFRHERAMGTAADAAWHTDILEVFAEFDRAGRAPRLAVLGEPGSGKSFSLRRLAARYANRARNEDPGEPVPLLVELGKWTVEALSFEAFLKAEIEPLGEDFTSLVEAGRALLLLDALNEIPTAQQSYKVEQITPWLADRRLAGIVITCRERDFVGDLRLDTDTLTIEPLDPPRVHLFIERYLNVIDSDNAPERTEAFFWRLATGDEPWRAKEVERAWRDLREKGFADFAKFWRPDESLLGPPGRQLPHRPLSGHQCPVPGLRRC